MTPSPACSGASATYLGKVLDNEVPMQVVSILMLDERNALDLVHELECLIRDRARARRLAAAG